MKNNLLVPLVLLLLSCSTNQNTNCSKVERKAKRVTAQDNENIPNENTQIKIREVFYSAKQKECLIIRESSEAKKEISIYTLIAPTGVPLEQEKGCLSSAECKNKPEEAWTSFQKKISAYR